MNLGSVVGSSALSVGTHKPRVYLNWVMGRCLEMVCVLFTVRSCSKLKIIFKTLVGVVETFGLWQGPRTCGVDFWCEWHGCGYPGTWSTRYIFYFLVGFHAQAQARNKKRANSQDSDGRHTKLGPVVGSSALSVGTHKPCVYLDRIMRRCLEMVCVLFH
jgi:hypothetical protein